jgi:hypothetical protein
MDKNAQDAASLSNSTSTQGQVSDVDSQQQTMKNLDDFMEGLLQASGVSEGMPEETKKMMKDEMTRTLLNQIDRAAIDELTEEQAAELAKKVDEPDFTSKMMTEYVEKCGVDYGKITLDTMVQFRRFYLGE